MGHDGRRGTRLPRGAVLRPVAMLVAGVAAGLVLWRLLTLEPAPPGATRVSGPERITRGERAALERLLRDGPPRPAP